MPALELECVCSGAGASLCVLAGITFHAEISHDPDPQSPPFSGLPIAELTGTGVGQTLDLAPGTYDFVLNPVDWVPVWDSVHVVWGTNASLSYGCCHSPGDVHRIRFHFVLTYTCTNLVTGGVVTAKVYSYNQSSASSTSPTPGRSLTFGGPGNASAAQFGATPLGDNFSQISLPDFFPSPKNTTTIDVNGAFCLCATGGTGIYTYDIESGSLPCGKTLNTSTGCITGTADGTCRGSDFITFIVRDSAGATATATCIFIEHCGGKPASRIY